MTITVTGNLAVVEPCFVWYFSRRPGSVDSIAVPFIRSVSLMPGIRQHSAISPVSTILRNVSSRLFPRQSGIARVVSLMTSMHECTVTVKAFKQRASVGALPKGDRFDGYSSLTVARICQVSKLGAPLLWCFLHEAPGWHIVDNPSIDS